MEVMSKFKDVFLKTGSYDLLFLMLNVLLGKIMIEIRTIEFTDQGVEDLVTKSLEFAFRKIVPPNPIEFVAKLPLTHITLLVIAKKLIQGRAELISFEHIYESYKGYIKRLTVKRVTLERPQLLKIFLELIQIGMLTTDSSSEGEHMHKAKVGLRISLDSFDEYLDENKLNLPEELKEWARMPLI